MVDPEIDPKEIVEAKPGDTGIVLFHTFRDSSGNPTEGTGVTATIYDQNGRIWVNKESATYDVTLKRYTLAIDIDREIALGTYLLYWEGVFSGTTKTDWSQLVVGLVTNEDIQCVLEKVPVIGKGDTAFDPMGQIDRMLLQRLVGVGKITRNRLPEVGRGDPNFRDWVRGY